MDSIVPCRRTISDRFPIASFRVRVAEPRYYEVACTTDPRLLHPDYAARRTQENFFTSRSRGLVAVSSGEHTWLMPPEVLRRFVGARRIYYALGTYAGRNGEQPRFTVSPQSLDQVPCLSLSPDFTGRGLDRSRVGGRKPASATYGGGSGRSGLRWGGDDALAYERQLSAGYRGDDDGDYDDGYDPSLWSASEALEDADEPEDDDEDGDSPELEDGTSLPGPATARVGGRRVPARIKPCDPDGYGRVARRGGQRTSSPPAPDPSPIGRGVPRFGGSNGDDGEELEDGAAFFLAHPEALGAYGRRRRPAYGRRSRTRHSDYRDEYEEESLPVGPASRPLGTATLTIAEMVRILRVVARRQSGQDGYQATVEDRDGGGLSWGLLLFNQGSGELGRVLSLAKRRDEQLGTSLSPAHRFDQLFGPRAQDLVRQTDPEQTPNAAERLAPVEGKRLSEEPWRSRFRAAGAVPYVQAAQNEVAVERFFRPVLPLARALGINSARGLAVLVDRLIHMGVGGGSSWIMRAAGPVRTEADRAAALRALGYEPTELGRFQREHGVARADGQWGPLTHAALTRALKRLGTASPLVLTQGDDALQTIAEAADSTDFRDRILAFLRDRTNFDDLATFDLR